MNLLALVCVINSFVFIVLGIFIYRLDSRELVNKISMLIEFSFAIWALSYAFLFASPTAAEAMLWHKIGSIGWIMISALTFHFFLAFTGRLKHPSAWLLQALLYGVPFLLLAVNIAFPQSILAQRFIESTAGWGWTYIINTGSLWFWVYIVYMVVFFGYSFISFIQWVRKNRQRYFIRNARIPIIISGVMVVAGCFSDIILPIITPAFPPMAIIFIVLWGLLISRITEGYRFLGIEKTATSEMILQTVMSPILLLDDNQRIVLCNQALLDLLKLNREQMINKPVKDFIQHRNGIEIQLIDAQGKTIEVLATFSRIDTGRVGGRGTVVSLQDITQFKKIEQDLSWRNEKYRELSDYLDHMANYDDLTSLPNRWLFFKRLDEAIEEYEKTGFGFTLIFIDLDGFKAVNDCFGHQAGDQLLVEVANRFNAIVRQDDLIARIGGDEFVLLFADSPEGAELDTYNARVEAAFAEPIVINNESCPIGLSIGMSRCPDDGISVDGLVRAADQRMYQNKMAKKHVG